MADADFETFLAAFQRERPWLPQDLALHYARLYGTRARALLAGAASLAALGRKFGPTLYEAEARYLRDNEWAETAEDILIRRTKHGLHMTPDEKAAFASWFESAPASAH